MKIFFAFVIFCLTPLVLGACTTSPAATEQACCVNCSEAGCCRDDCCGDPACSDCEACESCGSKEASMDSDRNVAVITAAGMGCPLCAANIDRQLKRIDGFKDTQMNLETGELFVHFEAGVRPSKERLAQAITDAGFTVDSVRWQADVVKGGTP